MGLLSKLLFPPKCTSCLKLLDFETPDNMALCPDCENLWVSEQKETCGVCAIHMVLRSGVFSINLILSATLTVSVAGVAAVAAPVRYAV